MNPFLQQAPIENVKHIIAVGSGKGGVGKSTVAVNLAAALSKLGQKVGILDADIYGPSVPRMLGLLNRKPEMDAQGKIQPVRGFGINAMSMGFLIEEGAAVVWRGPMLFKAMEQLLRDVNWGELDYLIVDLPPGTGDVALTLAQKVPVNGAIVVCTPQNVALTDAKKALDMFERINIPVLGVVENMSYMRTDTGEQIQLFPKGDLDRYLDAKKLTKLAELPFYTEVGLSSEAGVPLVDSHSGEEQSTMFINLAQKLLATFN
jgi:ATP-binding protein involved in chromosome partitioning